MNRTVMENIWKSGALLPFDKNGNKMPMKNGRIEGGVPEYLLVIIPEREQRRNNAFYVNQTITVDNAHPCDYVTTLTLCGSFVDYWIPRLLIGNHTNRVNNVQLQCVQNVLPVVMEGDANHINDMANSSKLLRHYIFRLDNWYRSSWNTFDGDSEQYTMQLKFRPVTPYTKVQAIENIQSWFRKVLGLWNPVDIASTYPKFALQRVGDGKTYKRTRIGCDIKKAFPPLDGMIRPRPDDFDGDVLDYCEADVLAAMDAFKYLKMFKENNMVPGIKKVIFNKPCTIVLWEDGTKTIVRTQGKARFDKEKGLAMCIAKKALGNKGNYYDEFRKWMK